MLDGLKGYVSLVSGLTEATAAKAREVATALLAQGGVQGVPAGASAMATQIAGLAEDLLVTARDNRGMLMEVVRAEAERAVASVGVITIAEADTLRGRITDLERELAAERARAAALTGAAAVRKAAPRTTTPSGRRATAPVTTPPRATKAAATKVPATKVPATRARPTKAAATKAAATKVPATKVPATKTAATKTAATTSAAPAAATKKAATKKAATKKAATKKASTTKATARTTTPGAGTGE